MKGTRRLLLFDGFDSHCTKEFLKVLEENKITPYRLPAHTSHFLQPLDVGCFQPYKHWYAEVVDAATRTGCTSFNKVDFLYAIKSIRRFTFKDKTIRRGWKDVGLLPHNWDLILHNI
jgi:DDE superfamily endonuclease